VDPVGVPLTLCHLIRVGDEVRTDVARSKPASPRRPRARLPMIFGFLDRNHPPVHCQPLIRLRQMRRDFVSPLALTVLDPARSPHWSRRFLDRFRTSSTTTGPASCLVERRASQSIGFMPARASTPWHPHAAIGLASTVVCVVPSAASSPRSLRPL